MKPFFIYSDIVLFLCVVAAVVMDIKYRLIPNKITVAFALVGIGLNTYMLGIQGFIKGIEGLLLGIALLFFFFVMGGIGGGDVKLLGAIGAVKGPAFVFNTFLYGAVWGGLAAVVVLLINKQLVYQFKYIIKTGKRLLLFAASRGKIPLQFEKPPATNISMPYGAAISLGALTVMLLGGM